jgi:hypothetical protein
MAVAHLMKYRLLQLLDMLMNPKKYGTSEKEGDDILIAFCAGCPDPINARWLIVECLEPMTDEEIVDRALMMPPRKIADIPFSVVPKGHPSRVTLQ